MFKTRKFVVLAAIFLVLPSLTRADTLAENHDFFISKDYEYLGRDKIKATLWTLTPRAYFYISDEYFNALAPDQKNEYLNLVADLGREFDSVIYPKLTNLWGKEPDPGVDGDSRITILLARLQDEAGGYFDTRHLYSGQQAEGSNQREIIFLNSRSIIERRAKLYLAHEFQHLTAFNQKTVPYGVVGDTWLNEARSEYSIRFLGYDDNFQSSNLVRRLSAFLREPSDPLGEWKNTNSDYGVVTLFMNYLVDQYGDRILVDSLHSRKTGIISLDEALIKNGIFKSFAEIFTDWAITNYLNDQSINSKFGYSFPSLKNIHISSTQRIFLAGTPFYQTSVFVKDWQPLWYEFNFSNTDSRLKISLSSDKASGFILPAILKHANGQKEVVFIPTFNPAPALIKNISSDIVSIVLIPILGSKTSNFLEDDPGVNFTLKIEPVRDSDNLVEPTAYFPKKFQEGDLISFNGVGYVIKDDWVRPLSKEVINLYGHLKDLTPILVNETTFRRYTVSNYIRPVNSQRVYAVWPDNTKHWFNMTGEYFLSSGRSFDAVYVVSEVEANLYKEGAAIRK